MHILVDNERQWTRIAIQGSKTDDINRYHLAGAAVDNSLRYVFNEPLSLERKVMKCILLILNNSESKFLIQQVLDFFGF